VRPSRGGTGGSRGDMQRPSGLALAGGGAAAMPLRRSEKSVGPPAARSSGDNTCRHYVWTLCVDTMCGHYVWTACVTLCVDNVCDDVCEVDNVQCGESAAVWTAPYA
jgi:hypothetical protein